MLRAAAALVTVLAALVLGGCGDERSSDAGTSTPTATASPAVSARSEYYSAMNDLVRRLDRAVAAAIDGEAHAVKRIGGVVRDVRERLKDRRAAGDGESPAGSLLLTTAQSARDYAKNGDRAGLQLIRDVPILEARDALRSEAPGG